VAPTLHDILLNPEARPQVVTECQQLVDDEVADKSGVSGLAVKTGYAAVKKFKPGIIGDVVEALLDEFVGQLEPFYAEHTSANDGRSLAEYFGEHSDKVAEALLSITDKRAEASERAMLRKTYQKMRPNGKENVVAALPRLAALIERHAR
jgi:hypothetical protein